MNTPHSGFPIGFPPLLSPLEFVWATEKAGSCTEQDPSSLHHLLLVLTPHLQTPTDDRYLSVQAAWQ